MPNAIAARLRPQLVQMVEEGGIAKDGARWLRKAEAATVQALTSSGEVTATDLAREVPALRERLHFGQGKRWEGYQSLSTRVLWVLAAEGRILRGRPLGSWTSSQHRWTLTQTWLGAPLATPAAEHAQVELVRRWLAAFGPGTVADIKWWTGWTVREVRRVLVAIRPAEVDLDGRTGLVLPDDVEPVARPTPWVAFLPALDPTVMGWAERSWYLGEHGPVLFERSGNAGPTVWWDGRVVGGWVGRKTGEIVFRILEDIGKDGEAAVAAEAERLQRWLGPIRVTPRFHTPLELELSA